MISDMSGEVFSPIELVHDFEKTVEERWKEKERLCMGEIFRVYKNAYCLFGKTQRNRFLPLAMRPVEPRYLGIQFEGMARPLAVRTR
jgi:hypothetical protein